MTRRKLSREFKFAVVKKVRDRGVRSAQASRALGIRAAVQRKGVQESEADPAQVYPGYGQVKPAQLRIDRLRKEDAKLKAERDIPEKGLAGRTPGPCMLRPFSRRSMIMRAVRQQVFVEVSQKRCRGICAR
jgi:transposase